MVDNHILQEMKVYYQQRAEEYDEWFYRLGRYDRGSEGNRLWFAEVDQVVAALEDLQMTGDVLELAPGTGIWTARLLQTATTVTAVDASSEMIRVNQAKVASERVSYIQSDLFSWQPTRLYDAVFFGFWISHVPLERLDTFLRSVAAMLHPGGKVFFVDGRREPSSTATDHTLPEPDSQIMTRLLNDGRAFEIVKNFYAPTELAARCSKAGLDVRVVETETFFIYASGTRR
jgi:2-polyprenyl-3-methyl-5-hydroxy-6-metoxy-1,4-benzoquinol methylase